MTNEVKIYTDGSWSSNKPDVAGWSFLVVVGDKIVHYQYGQAPSSSQQIGGELKAAMAGLLWASKNNVSKVNLCHDYTGVAFWAEGTWKAKKELPMKYASFVQSLMRLMTVEFVKVPAHAGDKFNELADKLAKRGVMEG